MLWLLLSTLRAGAPPPPDTVLLPAGTFTLGSTRQPDEQPLREVTLPALRIDRTEVRLETWRALAMGGHGLGPNHPVVGVTWAEADAFCRARGGRLPTEAEWERACRGGSGGPYPWGEGADRPAVWWDEVKLGKYGHLRGISTVEQPDPSTATPEGVLELAGSVWEWTSSDYQRNPSATTSASPWKVLRGGSYANLPSYGTCTHREPARPDAARLTVGFRCVYDLTR